MMLQRFSQRTQRKFVASLVARDAGAAYERRQQRQSSPRAEMARLPQLRLKALKLIACKDGESVSIGRTFRL
jgi:hypothetical protein